MLQHTDALDEEVIRNVAGVAYAGRINSLILEILIGETFRIGGADTVRLFLSQPK